VPSLLPSFSPNAPLTVSYAGVGNIAPGQPLTKEQSAPNPTVTVNPANSSVSLAGNFTIMMVDADVVGSDPTKGVNHHWLVNGVQISGNALSNASATSIVAYAGPGPAPGSGPHRYVIILYSQPSSFTPPADLSKPTGVLLFNLQEYVKNSGLGPIAGATYFTVEEGTTTASISATSPVVSSTLAPTSATGTSTNLQSPTTTGASGSNGSFKVASYSLLPLLIVAFIMAIVV